MNRQQLERVSAMIISPKTYVHVVTVGIANITDSELNQLLACDGNYKLETKLINKWRING